MHCTHAYCTTRCAQHALSSLTAPVLPGTACAYRRSEKLRAYCGITSGPESQLRCDRATVGNADRRYRFKLNF